MRGLAGALTAAALLGGCGGGDASAPKTAPSTPTADVVMQTGCLACHRIGSQGNDGPGQDLTHVGARLSAAAIRAVLIDAPAPMPSFRTLPADTLDALVAYLSGLR